MPRGYQLSQEAHITPVIYPKDATGGTTGDCVNMAKYGHVSFILKIGAAAAALTGILIESCTAANGAGASAIPFTIYPGETSRGTAGSDVLAAKVSASAGGYTPPNVANIFYVIELPSMALPVGVNAATFLRVRLTAPASSIMVQCDAILSGGRYVGDQNSDATASALI